MSRIDIWSPYQKEGGLKKRAQEYSGIHAKAFETLKDWTLDTLRESLEGLKSEGKEGYGEGWEDEMTLQSSLVERATQATRFGDLFKVMRDDGGWTRTDAQDAAYAAYGAIGAGKDELEEVPWSVPRGGWST